MKRVVWLGILWTALIAGLVSSSAVISCLDGNACKSVRVILQQPDDVYDVPQEYPQAQVVDFHGNLIESFGQPPRVEWKKLNLSYNLLAEVTLGGDIQNRYLEDVDLTYNQLKTVSVPSSVINFIAERNQLYDITFEPHSRLQRLILPKNQFQSLDKFSTLPQLQELDLSCNDLSTLPVDKLPATLRTLKLARNHIYVISGQFKSLYSLEYLDLSHNILTMFAEVQTFFPSVRKLYLQNNKIVMWVDVEKTNNQFQEVNLLENDWHCPNLEKVLNKINHSAIQGSRSAESSCKAKYKFICCSVVESPYADRLIKYRKQAFKALQIGANQSRGDNLSCSKYEHSPCDTDDNLVYKVAGSAVKDAKSLAKSSLEVLEQVLQQQKNIVDKTRANVQSFEGEIGKQSAKHADLVSYIGRQYTEALPPTEQSLKGRPNSEVEKLQQLFSYFDRENGNLKNEIDAEERRNKDKQDEVSTIEKEISDLQYQKDRLMEDVDKRNTTVNGYKAKIAALQQKLG